jgi:hypothetical protein
MVSGDRRWWPGIRRIWITTGISATVVFVTWSLLASRASSEARQAIRSDTMVEVARGAHHWTFKPRVGAPRTARHIRIDGGNHSQFGSYGFQPGDWPATISRAEQQRLTLEATLEMLRAVER